MKTSVTKREEAMFAEMNRIRCYLATANQQLAAQVAHSAMLRATLLNALTEIDTLGKARGELLRRVIDLETKAVEVKPLENK